MAASTNRIKAIRNDNTRSMLFHRVAESDLCSALAKRSKHGIAKTLRIPKT